MIQAINGKANNDPTDRGHQSGKENGQSGAVASDTGPGLAIIAAVAHRVDESLTCDLDGALAAAGRVNEAVLTELLADPYFHAAPPKSTGQANGAVI